MILPISRSLRLLTAASLCALASSALAQQRGGATSMRPTTNTQPTVRSGVGGGGSGASSASGGSRQYTNTTMVGDAMITSDPETRRLIIVTDEDTNTNIKTIIASLDKPKPQVLINVVFVQVTHTDDLDLGAEARLVGNIAIKHNPDTIASTRFGVAAEAANPLGYGAFYQLTAPNINATLHALASKNKTQILSRPSILTRSSQQATIMVGQSVPLITNSRVSDTTNTTINTVQYQDVGIILRVTPFITEEGLVEMIVSPEISSLSATTVPISNTVSSPVIDKRSADTVVVTPSDQTIVIGGLISTQKNSRDSQSSACSGTSRCWAPRSARQVKDDEKTELLIFRGDPRWSPHRRIWPGGVEGEGADGNGSPRPSTVEGTQAVHHQALTEVLSETPEALASGVFCLGIPYSLQLGLWKSARRWSRLSAPRD
jgi:general secretion pathway protein D